jgi:hypothetical protein
VGRYVPGETVVVDFTFAGGNDPTAVTAVMRKPDGEEVDLDANVSEPQGTGAFSVSYDFADDDPPGDYLFDIRGTGNVRGAVLWRVHLDDNGFTDS